MSEQHNKALFDNTAQGQGSGALTFDVPTVDAPLPSDGLVYPTDSPLHNMSSVTITSMTAAHENILTNRSFAKQGNILTKLLESCICDKRINVKTMLTGDRNTVMVALRITGYGPEYRVQAGCPECGEASKQTFALDNLPIRRLQIKPRVAGTNMFEFQLPQSKRTVVFKFLTGADEDELSAIQAQKKKAGLESNNDLVTLALLHSVVSIDGVTDKAELARALPKMPAFDSRALRNFIEENEPGMQLKGMMACPHCGTSSEVDMPLGADFFWPKSK